MNKIDVKLLDQAIDRLQAMITGGYPEAGALANDAQARYLREHVLPRLRGVREHLAGTKTAWDLKLDF